MQLFLTFLNLVPVPPLRLAREKSNGKIGRRRGKTEQANWRRSFMAALNFI